MITLVALLALMAFVAYLLQRNHARQGRPDVAGGDPLGSPFWR